MKITLRSMGLVGLLLFGSLFALTYGVPERLEASAKTFVKHQITRKVTAQYQQFSDHAWAQKAQSLADRMGLDQDKLKQKLADQLPEKIAAVLAKMCGYDCEKRKQLAANIKSSYLERIKKLGAGQERLTELVKGQYVKVVAQLRMDVRIFLGGNAVMFGLLLLISWLKPQAMAHLFVPGMLLFVATLIASSIYVFGQNWFYTIIFNDYMGYAYLAYLGVIFGLLLDVVMNQARVCTHIFNGIGHGISSVGSISPC